MRTRREIYAVTAVIVVCILVLVGTIYFQTSLDSVQTDAPQDHNIAEDAPADVEENPPGAVGSIDEP